MINGTLVKTNLIGRGNYNTNTTDNTFSRLVPSQRLHCRHRRHGPELGGRHSPLLLLFMCAKALQNISCIVYSTVQYSTVQYSTVQCSTYVIA